MHTNGYHSHTHNHCKHDFLQYCEHCDICFCTKCGKEWGNKVTYTYSIEPYVWTYRGIPYTVTYNSGNYALTTSNGTAVTNKDVMTAFYSSTNATAHAHNTIK